MRKQFLAPVLRTEQTLEKLTCGALCISNIPNNPPGCTIAH